MIFMKQINGSHTRNRITGILFLLLCTLLVNAQRASSGHNSGVIPADGEWIKDTSTTVHLAAGKPVDHYGPIPEFGKKLNTFSNASESVTYFLTLAADIPDNNNPGKVLFQKEPGHVFLILTKKDSVSGGSQSMVWGFYPRRPLSSIFLKRVKSELRDNGNREYNISITCRLTADGLDSLRSAAVALSFKKYDLNRFNCYDYAVNLFNAVQKQLTVPVSYMRFPLVLGKGGTPCSLYKDIAEMAPSALPVGFTVQTGVFYAPSGSNKPLLTIK
jgi:hypothetical protein